MPQTQKPDDTPEVDLCIQECIDCAVACSQASTHCLTMGGKYASFIYINILRDCMQICNVTADYLARGSAWYKESCMFCADVCEKCASILHQLDSDDDTLKACSSMCRACAQICRSMITKSISPAYSTSV